jgi:hypothetical protein
MGVASDAYVSFEYGTTQAFGSTTAEVAQAAIGTFSATISEPSYPTYYRARTRVGAVYSYGATQLLSTGRTEGFDLLRIILTTIIAGIILIGVVLVGLSIGMQAALAGAVIGIVALAIVIALLNGVG